MKTKNRSEDAPSINVKEKKKKQTKPPHYNGAHGHLAWHLNQKLIVLWPNRNRSSDGLSIVQIINGIEF